MNKTPWFTHKKKPARPGVYLTRNLQGGHLWWRAWDGKSWNCGYLAKNTITGETCRAPSYENATHQNSRLGSHVSIEWCGLSKEPK